MTITVNVKAADGATTQIALADPVVQTATGSAHYVATLTLGTTVYTFDSANAVDQGNYVGQFVQQKSLMVAPAGCPFTVFFRPDVDGGRDEVVVELGKMWSGTPAHVTTPYTFSVTKNGAALFSTTVPKHWWWARWRWQSAVRPFVRTAASLIADGHFLPYSTDYLYGYTSPSNFTYGGVDVPYTIMGRAGLVAATGGTGDRPELGPMTLCQSDYILLGTAKAKTVMIAQAEASATMGFHIRDENTGAWLDNRLHPNYSMITGAGSPPWIPRPADASDPDYFQIESAHAPFLCYAPFMFTDDPYYLEELQALALFHIVCENWFTTQQSLPGLVDASQTRAFGWGVRVLACAVKSTPDTVPNWLGTKAHWAANLADNRTFLQKFINSPARVHSIFHACTQSAMPGSFQEDYKNIAMAWVVRMGFTDWAVAHVWTLGSILPQLTGDMTGWPKAWSLPYYWADMTTGINGNPVLVSDTSSDSKTYPSWNAAFQRYVADNKATVPSLAMGYPPTWDGNQYFPDHSAADSAGVAYAYWRGGNLHLAAGLGVPNAASASVWWDTVAIPAAQAKWGVSKSDPRWSYAKV